MTINLSSRELLLSSWLLAVSLGANAQSFSCTPEHVTFAGRTKSGITVETTTVNWNRLDYHIVDKKVVLMTYKDTKNPTTTLNPLQREDGIVVENSPERIVMLTGLGSDVTMDVIFPEDGAGYSFYASDYPKRMHAGKGELINISKLYVLRCKDVTKAKK